MKLPPLTDATTFVVFGATGDLFARKIIPSLYLLHIGKHLPETFSVIGFGRRPLTDKAFRELVFINLKKVAPDVTMRRAHKFLNLFSYHQGEFHDDESFKNLKQRLDDIDITNGAPTAKSFYLAVPPELVTLLVPRIAQTAKRGKGTRSLIVEKPFGTNEKSARELNIFIQQFFREKEIYRIDHYLAKPALDTLLHARTKHKSYNHILRDHPIKKIDITLFEMMGVEKRGSFYDGVGALRDVGQNHLLEMLALAIMPLPKLTALHICNAREEFIKNLPKLTRAQILKNSTRAQYKTYLATPGVKENSSVETYFDLTFKLNHAPYKGVPVTIRTGKKMAHIQKDVVLHFSCEAADSLHIELEPKPRLYFKKGTLITHIEDYEDPEPTIQYANEYASLFMHAWLGDSSLFPTKKEVEYAWAFVDPVLKAWNSGVPELKTYAPNAELPWQ